MRVDHVPINVDDHKELLKGITPSFLNATRTTRLDFPTIGGHVHCTELIGGSTITAWLLYISTPVVANMNTTDRGEKQITWLPYMSIRVEVNTHVTHQDLWVIKCRSYRLRLDCQGRLRVWLKGPLVFILILLRFSGLAFPLGLFCHCLCLPFGTFIFRLLNLSQLPATLITWPSLSTIADRLWRVLHLVLRVPQASQVLNLLLLTVFRTM
jgi:hypothetical protein